MVQFRTLPPLGGSQREISEVVRQLMNGKSNNSGTITLDDGSATTTTLYNERIGYDSCVLLMPETANAASDLANIYIDTFAQGSAVINHSANTDADKTFRYIIVG
jgi:hypothetical protein